MLREVSRRRQVEQGSFALDFRLNNLLHHFLGSKTELSSLGDLVLDNLYLTGKTEDKERQDKPRGFSVADVFAGKVTAEQAKQALQAAVARVRAKKAPTAETK